MKHTVKEENDKEIKWELDISQNGTLCIVGNDETAIIIDPKGCLIITRKGSDLGIKFEYQVDTV